MPQPGPPWLSIPREQVRRFACPKCHARPRQRCRYKRWPDGVLEERDSNHRERCQLAAQPPESAHPRELPALTVPTVPTIPKHTVFETTDATTVRPRRESRFPGVEPATHAETLTVPCPKCDAEPGEECRRPARPDGVIRHKSSHHSERWRFVMDKLGRLPWPEHEARF